MQRYTAICRLTGDPVVRVSQDGEKKYARFSVAVNNGKTKAGEDKPATFFNCVAFGAQAEKCENKRLVKGTKIYLEGELLPNQYTGKDGVVHDTVELRVSYTEVLNSVKNNSTTASEDTGNDDGFADASNLDVSDFFPS